MQTADLLERLLKLNAPGWDCKNDPALAPEHFFGIFDEAFNLAFSFRETDDENTRCRG